MAVDSMVTKGLTKKAEDDVLGDPGKHAQNVQEITDLESSAEDQKDSSKVLGLGPRSNYKKGLDFQEQKTRLRLEPSWAHVQNKRLRPHLLAHATSHNRVLESTLVE